jgi:hypothetical protein
MTMGWRWIVVFFLVAPLLLGVTASSAQTAQAEPEPRYDASATVDAMTVVAEQREVPRGNALAGIHLMVRLESAKENSETIDVYLGPTSYIEDFQVTFVKGDRVQVTGSKVKYSGAPLILARQVRRDTTTIFLRDEHGTPYWRGKT